MNRTHSKSWLGRRGALTGAMGAMTLLAGCSTLGSLHHETRTMNVAHAAGSALSVVTANGAAHTERTMREDVFVEFDLFGPDEERLSFVNVHADRQGDGSLRVWVDWPGGQRKGNEGANIRIQIPDAIGVDVRTSNGAITLSGLAGHAKLHTSNGGVVVRDHSGSVDAESSNGSLRLERVDGDIIGDTSNGAIVVVDAFGKVELDTSNGRVFVSTAHTNPGPVRVSTSNGSVELQLGDGFEGVLRLTSSNARISAKGFENARLIESSKHALEMKIGSDETISAVRTSNGSVRVSPRGDD